jgi:hypothetical protein
MGAASQEGAPHAIDNDVLAPCNNAWWVTATMDWDDVRFFLAVARRRTLSAAARDLAVTQPTVGRRITAFEQRLGAKLYIRTPVDST